MYRRSEHVSWHSSLIFTRPASGSCPLRARSLRAGLASCPLAAPLQLLPGELAERVSDLMLARVTAVQVDHRGALAVVAHSIHQLPERRASAGGQCVSRVPEIMEMETGEPGRTECLDPHPLPEMAVPQRLPCRAGEDKPLVARLSEAAHMPAHNGNDHFGDRHTTRLPASDLGGPNSIPRPRTSVN